MSKYAYNYYFFLSLVIAISYLQCTTKIPSANNLPSQVTPESYSFLTDESVTHSSIDSLYYLYKEVNLDPHGFNSSMYGNYEWSEPAKVFISKGNLIAFNRDLENVFTDETGLTRFVKCFRNEPFAISAEEELIKIIDLNSKKVIQRIPLDGYCKNLQRLENDQIIASIEKKERKIYYQYIFEGSNLIKIDSIEIDSFPIKGHLSYSSNMKFLCFVSKGDVIIKDIDQGSETVVASGLFNVKVMFGNNGNRIIIEDKDYKEGKDNFTILSFPELKKIGGYSFSRNRISLLQERSLVVGDDGHSGKIQVIDLETGSIIFNIKEPNISGIGINSNEIVYSKKVNNQIHITLMDLKAKEVIEILKFKLGYIHQLVFSNDSQFLFFRANNIFYKLSLKTFIIEQLPIEAKGFYGEVRINSNDSMLGFLANSNLKGRRIVLFDLVTSQLKEISCDPVSEMLFGLNFDEIIVYNRHDRGASTKVFNIRKEKWVAPLKKTILPLPKNWKNPLDKAQIIFQSLNDSNTEITHFDCNTYDPSSLIINETKGSKFIGLDRHSNYYFIEKNGTIQCYQYLTGNLLKNIPTNFFQHLTKIYSTSADEVLYIKHRNKQFIFSPYEPHRYQILKDGVLLIISPNLEYLIQTQGKKMKIFHKL